jgi:hypothetical protein
MLKPVAGSLVREQKQRREAGIYIPILKMRQVTRIYIYEYMYLLTAISAQVIFRRPIYV